MVFGHVSGHVFKPDTKKRSKPLRTLNNFVPAPGTRKKKIGLLQSTRQTMQRTIRNEYAHAFGMVLPLPRSGVMIGVANVPHHTWQALSPAGRNDPLARSLSRHPVSKQ